MDTVCDRSTVKMGEAATGVDEMSPAASERAATMAILCMVSGLARSMPELTS